MKRFFISSMREGDSFAVLEGREAHHAVRVFRVSVGDAVEVLNGTGSIASCVVETVQNRRLELRIDLVKTESPSLPHVTLFQALTKGKSFDWSIQKAAELGVRRIVPVLCERVISRPHKDGLSEKTQRWRQTLIEAVKQSGNPWLPEVSRPVTFLEGVKESHSISRLSIFGGLPFATRRSVRSIFEEFRDVNDAPLKGVQIWIGPEGDFTPTEIDHFLAAGFVPVVFGRTVLRSETAAIVLIALVQEELANHSWND